LCRCVCHGTCLLAGHEPVSLTTWQELCECPGAAEQRAWKGPDDLWPGFTEHREKARREQQERREAKKQAEHAVRDAAVGGRAAQPSWTDRHQRCISVTVSPSEST
jgi:hypothetical protein